MFDMGMLFESVYWVPIMVDIAQLVERQIVVLNVVGSNPIIHPNEFVAQ